MLVTLAEREFTKNGKGWWPGRQMVDDGMKALGHGTTAPASSCLAAMVHAHMHFCTQIATCRGTRRHSIECEVSTALAARPAREEINVS